MAKRTFEIGLVGAGAISAGAYTAGVVDFLVHALDGWYAAKGSHELVPPHDVRLSVFAGASAGGITAALGAAYLGSDQPAVASEADAAARRGRNKLFDSWVERIDIAHLLGGRDLEDAAAPVAALLDSTVLDEIADAGLNVAPRRQRRPYLADDFEVLLTVTNLRGVPYAFEVLGDRPASYDMALHADHVRFVLGDAPGNPVDAYAMRWEDFGAATAVKEKLKRAALASGAFPLGLAPRTLAHVLPGRGWPDWYGARRWPVPTPDSIGPHRCVTHQAIPANWGALDENYVYRFQCVDGGVMNNEPLELARQALAGPDGRNPRQGEAADKAILLIDPFPAGTGFEPDYAPAPDLFGTALKLFAALKNQARFKPDELVLAARHDVFSRFMIAPSRDGAAHPIACGALGGFGGFLKRDFRAHDYFLGRRNAQKFLRDHFVLPEHNPLFVEWSERMRIAHCVRDPYGQPVLREGRRLLPIVPLVGAIRSTACLMPEWPRYGAADLKQLMAGVERRLDLVLDRLVRQHFRTHNPVVRLIAKLVLGRKKRDIAAYIEKTVAADLGRMKLME
ncbi:MAG: patatin-like phospholipase family protein [Pseudomonadota bacterium]